MRVLLMGATGAIGRPLIRSLKQHGHRVFGLCVLRNRRSRCSYRLRWGSTPALQYVELESRAFRLSEIDCVAMRYGFFYGPGTWFTNAGDMGERVRRHQVPVIGASEGVASFVHIEDSASATVTALECAPGPYNIFDDSPSEQRVWLRAFARACEARSRFKLPSRKLWRLLAATASITPRACAAPPTRRQTRTQFPPTFARVAPITSSPGLTRMRRN